MEPNRKKLILISAGIGLIAFVVANSIFRNQLVRIENLKAKVAEERTKNRILTQIGGIEKEIASYEPRITPKKDVEWLRRKVTEMADQAQVKIVSITPQAPDEKETYIRLPIRMEVECGYHQLGDFISKLESSKEFIKIDALDLTVKEVERGRTIAKVGLTVSTFYLKD